MSELHNYNAKRNFKKTSEPAGKKLKTKNGFSYLIQKHAASHLHYDFRLELDGTLKSWAVTKGPSLDPSVKRLAVEVEDHPVSYGSFEGTIPKGQYGGGSVMLWDVGSWEVLGDDPKKQLKDGKISFILHGERLQGEWSLVRMKWSEKAGKNNWLLIKKDDKFAKSGDADKLLKKFQTSVTTGRSMDEIAEKTSEKKIKKSKLPQFIEPQLATLIDKTPQDESWIHEIKFDGYRMQARIENGKVQMLTRTGQDWSEKFFALVKTLEKLPIKNAILDGEVVALDEKKRSNFFQLQEVLKAEKSEELQYYLFDLLFLNDEDLRGFSLLERKEKLQKLCDKKNLKNIFYSEHFEFRGEDFFNKICQENFEGLVSKLAKKPYFSGRNRYWLKSKCHKRQEFVIGGFTQQADNSSVIGALLLGVYKGKDLIYCGRVGTGFNVKTSQEIRNKLEKIRQEKSSFKAVSNLGKKGVIWVKPQLVCEVEFSEWTTDGSLRHPSFQGLRLDKPAREIQKEKPLSIAVQKTQTSGIEITHPQRIIFPKAKLTKEDLAQYYETISDHILPHVENRLISLLRCPAGIEGQCFFQRHEVINSEFIHELKTQNSPYIYIKDKKGLLTLIQFGVIEIHAWGSRIDKVSQPDRLIFDLDPDLEIPWKKVMEAAAEVKLRLDDFGLQSFLKTTGGKGLHVVVPMTRKYEWPLIKKFARKFAEEMAGDSSQKYVANMSKEKRRGKIFIDYLRNDKSATAVSAFSARARENATVATPLFWHELTEKLDPQKFTITTIAARLQKIKKDPWADLWKIKQIIPTKYL